MIEYKPIGSVTSIYDRDTLDVVALPATIIGKEVAAIALTCMSGPLRLQFLLDEAGLDTLIKALTEAKAYITKAAHNDCTIA
jgi:hypothetical protein